MDNDNSPQQTLQHYFDDLLSDNKSVRAVKPAAVERQNRPSAGEGHLQLATATVSAHRQRVAKLLESGLLPANADADLPAPDREADIETYVIDGLEWADNGRPVWAQDKFDILLFKVSGLTLAVPLMSLGQILPLNDGLTPIFGQAEWFMGLLPTATGKVHTVNTAKFVMPERYDEGFLQTAKYVISINGLPWGLAVDSVNQPITLEPQEVNWRTKRYKRAWLAGTVREHMCALLDIPMMGKLLLEADIKK